MSSLSWYALGIALTTAGLIWSWTRYQNQGAAAGMRAAAWSLLPAAAAFTGLLRLTGQIAEDVSRWLTRLVFSPVVWLGFGIAGFALVLFVLSGWLGRKSNPESVAGSPKKSVTTGAAATGSKAGSTSDLDEIEEILRKHGIQ